MSLFKRKRLYEAYVATFESPMGREVLLDLCRRYNIASTSFTSGDPHLTSFHEGQRHVVLSILRVISRDVGSLVDAIGEANQREDE